MQRYFKNRIIHEDKKCIDKLKKTYIEMNDDKITTSDTPNGLFAISIQPNCFVDEMTLQNDFSFILCLYYHWMYGSKWHKIKYLQQQFNGIIERQQGQHNHIHITLYNWDIEELAIFVGYIKQQLQTIYPKVSIDCQRIYDLKGWQDYISSGISKKDQFVHKRRLVSPIPISHITCQQKHLWTDRWMLYKGSESVESRLTYPS